MTEKEILESTYNDTCTIKRKDNVKNEHHVTKQSYKAVPGYTDLPCALSKKEMKFTNQTDNENMISETQMLFISSEYDIQAGDQVIIILGVNGQEKIFTAGNSFVYCTHQEVPLKYSERA